MKLNRDLRYSSDQDFYWVGHPDVGEPSDLMMQELIEHRYELDIIGGIVDDEASYDYDEFALVKWQDKFYLLSTSGCSCPSPTETWMIEIGPATIEEIRAKILSGDYAGYTLPKKKSDEFLLLLKKAEA